MINTIHYKGAVWLDLDNPSQKDVNEIKKTYEIQDEIASYLLVPNNKARIDTFKNIIYICLHFPVFKHSHSTESAQEIDFIIGKDFIITARYDSVDALHKVSKLLETESILDKDDIQNPSGYIFFRILRELYDSLFNELAFLDNWANTIEAKIFKENQKGTVEELSNASKILIDFKRILFQHKEVLESLKEYGAELYGAHFGYHTRNIIHEYTKLRNLIESQRDIISELRETNNSIISTKQNEVAKVIAVLAFIAVPISLLVSLFQIETKTRPIVGMDNDFWILLIFVFSIGILLFAFFKSKKWL